MKKGTRICKCFIPNLKHFSKIFNAF